MALLSAARAEKHEQTSETLVFIDSDDAPLFTQADLDRAVFRVGGNLSNPTRCTSM